MDGTSEDTSEFAAPVSGDDEVEWLLARLAPLVSVTDQDPRRRLLAALIAAWPLASDGRRFDAARILLTLEQRDVWFLTSHDPVEALDDAAAELMVEELRTQERIAADLLSGEWETGARASLSEVGAR